jgi:hypothetical protein
LLADKPLQKTPPNRLDFWQLRHDDGAPLVCYRTSDTQPSGVQYIALCSRLHHLWLVITPARRSHASELGWSYPEQAHSSVPAAITVEICQGTPLWASNSALTAWKKPHYNRPSVSAERPLT